MNDKYLLVLVVRVCLLFCKEKSGAHHSTSFPRSSLYFLEVERGPWERGCPSLGACNYSAIFLSRRFHRPIIFSLNLSRIQIPTGTSVTNCNHKHGLMLTCRHVHVSPHCFNLTEACSCRLNWPFRGKNI